MRALEIALHMWARELGVDQFSAIELENWKNILDAAAKKVKELEQQPKGSTKDTELQYYGETTAHFRSVKDAWRNHVSHARTTYDERETTSILNHVREFIGSTRRTTPQLTTVVRSTAAIVTPASAIAKTAAEIASVVVAIASVGVSGSLGSASRSRPSCELPLPSRCRSHTERSSSREA